MDADGVISGFRIERRLKGDSLGRVYQATQLSLGRTVALRLMEQSLFTDRGFSERFREQQRLSAAVHHPHIVPTYEAGDWDGGKFVATRFVKGRTLAELLEDGSLSPSQLEFLLESIAAALDVAHEAGLVHGRLTACNVLIDAGGRAYLADLGLGRAGSAAADREAFASLADQAERGVERSRGPSLGTWVVTGFAVLALVLVAVLLVAGGDHDGGFETEPSPPVASAAVPIGSALSAGPTPAIGCSDQPGPNTPACTLSQATIDGRRITVEAAGVIRGWAVRGAIGDLTLQVIDRRNGRAFVRGFSQLEQVPDLAPHAFAANVRVRRGDRIGVLLGPGAVIGARIPPQDTLALRWGGALAPIPQAHGSSPLDRELLLRVDVEVGARPTLPRQLTGGRAAAAMTGHTLARTVVDLSDGAAARVELVRVEGGLALDSFRGKRRLARIAVPDADPSGRLLNLDAFAYCGHPLGFCLRWLNEGEVIPVVHSYRLARDGEAFLLIG